MNRPASGGSDEEKTMRDAFRRFAHRASDIVGSPAAFLAGLIVIVIWGVTGPIFRYSDTWQLIINTGTTIITFLMVFLIQNTQNRDSRAIHLKLDELIRSVHTARNELVGLEELSDEDLDEMQREFTRLREHAERKLHSIEEHRSRRHSGKGRREKDGGAGAGERRK
jgi:low affinity Fe/Cu permease